VLVPLALTLRLLVAAGDKCYFVGNSRLVELPSCALSPSTIDDLTEEGAPASSRSLQSFRAGTRLPAFQSRRSTVVVRGNEELEQRVEEAEQRRVDAVAQKVVAEEQQREAEQQRDAAARQLAAARKELSALRAKVERLERSGCGKPDRPAARNGRPRRGSNHHARVSTPPGGRRPARS
jgi:hypothetical protein